MRRLAVLQPHHRRCPGSDDRAGSGSRAAAPAPSDAGGRRRLEHERGTGRDGHAGQRTRAGSTERSTRPACSPAGCSTGSRATTGSGVLRSRPRPLPERIIQIPDNPYLDPGSGTFVIEIRYRTKEKFGNIIQKGQSHTVGGQWKIQNPQGIPSCLFRSQAGSQVATGAKTPLNDNAWHVLTCVKTPTSVTMYVDGVYRNKKNGTTGNIDNKKSVTIGGKIECDQIAVTCDYFSGQIDYVKISHS